MKRSWWRAAALLLCGILLTSLLFFLGTSVSAAGQIRRTVEAENRNALRLWSRDVESRTGALYEHVHELLVTLYNSNQLRTGTPVMDARTKQRILDMMEEKLIVSADADAFFVFDTENDFYLFSAATAVDQRAAHALKDHLRENALAYETPFRDRSWHICAVDGGSYFLKCARLGKYLVGAVSNLALYHIEDTTGVLGTGAACLLLSDGVFYPCGGEAPAGLDPAREDYGLSAGRSTVSAQVPAINARAVLTAEPVLAEGGGSLSPLLLLLDSALCVILVFILLRLLRRKVARPGQELTRANTALAQGDLNYRLDVSHAGSSEFGALYESFNDMASQITNLRIEAYDLRLEEEKNRLTMLRAQIKPHSFLNAITTISNMTYIAEPEEVRAYIATFAKFIRYMLNVNGTWVTLSEELAHIRNYMTMQEARFPGSIRFEVDCAEETLDHDIPFLLLYTLVENSVKHALTLYEELEVSVRCERLETEDFRGIRLTEEDSGEGFPDEVLSQLLSGDAVFAKEHLGLSNVRYTLHLLYGRDDLLRLSNRREGGACVEIRIPDREEDGT